MDTLSLVAGLGNPGSEYARTRHNVGHQVVDNRISTEFGNRWSFAGLSRLRYEPTEMRVRVRHDGVQVA